MPVVRAKHTVHLEDGYELFIVREDRNSTILLSLDKRTKQGMVRERTTVRIPIEKAYKMAKFICSLIELDER